MDVTLTLQYLHVSCIVFLFVLSPSRIIYLEHYKQMCYGANVNISYRKLSFLFLGTGTITGSVP